MFQDTRNTDPVIPMVTDDYSPEQKVDTIADISFFTETQACQKSSKAGVVNSYYVCYTAISFYDMF